MKPVPIIPQAGQESVWDYPRPARLEDVNKSIKVVCNGLVLASTNQAKRVIETSHPPTYYIPAKDIKMEYLKETSKESWCEWKGKSRYYDVSIGDQYISSASWSYVQPTPAFKALENYYSFYAGLMDACYVDDEIVIPQPGNFYGGWITSDVVGPFKGEPGTMGW
jgi:uncharacterized protein (DUF427 family)